MVCKRNRGFTLIELSLVMAFFSILLMAVLMLTIHVGKLYAKGVTNKSLNAVGRDISDMIRRDFAASDPTRIDPTVFEGGPAGKTHGRICLGSVSYVWNTTGLLNDTSSTLNVVKLSSGNKVKLVRVTDPSMAQCTVSGPTYPLTIPASDSPTDLLDGGDATGKRGFGVYNFTLTSPSPGLYRVKYTIGTYDPQTTDNSAGYVACKPPTDNQANFEYCSVADFDMYVRAGGSK